MNDGGWIKTTHTIMATAVEVLREDYEDSPITLFCLGPDVVVYIPAGEAERVAYEIIAALAPNTGEPK